MLPIREDHPLRRMFTGLLDHAFCAEIGICDPQLTGYLADLLVAFVHIDQLNTNSLNNHAEVIVCTDHVEPRNEQADQNRHGDMLCIGADAQWNLSHFRPGSSSPYRTEFYRGIFRHNIRKDDDFEAGGRASTLWLDGHVSTIEETTGENIPNRWYDPRGLWLNISK